MKVGRNDPCPCGSGKKYKQCCLATQQAPHPVSDALDAPSKALDWIAQRFGGQIRDLVRDEFYGDFDDDEALESALGGLSPGHAQMMSVNIGDWILFDAYFDRRSTSLPGFKWALGRDGPRLSNDQRAYLEAVSRGDLRLYEIVGVEPGQGVRMQDALDRTIAPRYAHERSASQSLRPGDMLGTRLVEFGGQTAISGALYPLNRLNAMTLIEEFRATCSYLTEQGEVLTVDGEHDLLSKMIRTFWLNGLLAPTLPKLVDASGESLLLIEDDYDVLDWAAVETALAAQADVEGARDRGWTRMDRGGENSHRILSSINPNDGGRTLTLFHRTLSTADKGRIWFDQLVGTGVRFRTRRTTDPHQLMTHGDVVEPMARSGTGGQALPDISPAQLSELISQMVHKTYANWCDEPLPVLDHRTPRQMIETAEGRERVRLLLNTYEHGEHAQAEQQGRRPVSYDFLWRALELTRSEP